MRGPQRQVLVAGVRSRRTCGCLFSPLSERGPRNPQYIRNPVGTALPLKTKGAWAFSPMNRHHPHPNRNRVPSHPERMAGHWGLRLCNNGTASAGPKNANNMTWASAPANLRPSKTPSVQGPRAVAGRRHNLAVRLHRGAAVRATHNTSGIP